ncbi:MAG: hypothetical protein E7564_05955 [Ruminococcaceae bacterium]|nr:hypothetical protein [Oscillospiraceae bacterium]
MKNKNTKDITLMCLALVVLLALVGCGLLLINSVTEHNKNEISVSETSKTIIRDGREYFPKQDITVVMVLGIDKFGVKESSNYYRNEGSADSIMLLIFNENEKVCDVLYLNRDTMVNMDVLGLKGEYAGVSYGQLALAHTYGDGMEESAVNVKNTLENFIHGLTVDYYVSMNMDAIPLANDAVGGVKVNVKDDFSKVNPTITKGEITLKGDQVIDFVRTRKEVGDQKNTSRMERQTDYLKGFLTALREKENTDTDFALKLYDSVSPYIVTDVSAKNLSSMLSRFKDFALGEIYTPEGENLIKDGHYQFLVDEESFDELTVKLFYSEK